MFQRWKVGIWNQIITYQSLFAEPYLHLVLGSKAGGVGSAYGTTTDSENTVICLGCVDCSAPSDVQSEGEGHRREAY